MLRRVGCTVVLFLGATSLIAFLVLTWMSRMAPAWYAPPDPKSPSVATVADDFEYEVVELAQRQRPQDDTWTATITEQQLNSWLVNRLPKWVAHDRNLEWPSALGTPQVRIEPGGISIAVPVGERSPRTVVARILPTLDNGKIRLRIDHVAVGRISMPGEPLGNLVETIEDVAPETLSDPHLQQAIALLSGEQAIDPVVELEDGRRVRLTRLQLAFGRLNVSAVTEPRASSD